MINSSASSFLDAMGKVLQLHTGTGQYLDRETGVMLERNGLAVEPGTGQIGDVDLEFRSADELWEVTT